MEIINRFLDEVCQIWSVLQVFCELDVFDKRRTDRALYLLREFIAIIEAFSKCLYLIAIASEADNVFSTICKGSANRTKNQIFLDFSEMHFKAL